MSFVTESYKLNPEVNLSDYLSLRVMLSEGQYQHVGFGHKFGALVTHLVCHMLIRITENIKQTSDTLPIFGGLPLMT